MERRIEHLEKKLQESLSEGERAETIIELAWAVKHLDPSRAIQLGTDGQELAEKLGLLKLIPKCMLAQAVGQLFKARLDQSEQLTLQALEDYRRQEDAEGERDSLNVLGSIHLRRTNYGEALDSYMDALRVSETHDDPVEPVVLINIGSVYLRLGDYERALDYYLRAKETSEQLEDRPNLRATTLLSVGNIYTTLEMYEKGLEYYDECIEIYRENEMRQGLAPALCNIGILSSKLGEYDKAQRYYSESLALFNDLEDRKGIADVLCNLGHHMGMMGKHKEAIDYYEESLSIYEELRSSKGAVEQMSGIARSMMELEDYEKAQEQLQSALEMAEKADLKPHLARIHSNLAEVNERLKRHREALEHYREHHRFSEELRSDKAEQRLHSMEITHQVEKSRKEAEIYRLRNVELAKYKTKLEQMIRQRNEELQREIRARMLSDEVRRQLEMELGRDQRLASLGKLAGGIAHDFNNILSVILGNAEMLLKGKVSSEHEQKLRAIVSAVESGGSLTQQLLEFSMNKPVRKSVIDLSKTVLRMVSLLERIVGENTRLVVNAEDDLPPVFGETQKLEQIVMNLVLNARDAMPEGGEIGIDMNRVATEAVVSLLDVEADAPSFVCLKVSDQGTGMTPEEIERIFDPFYTTKGEGRGTGLGLSVVHGLVKQHDGLIDVESDEGKGTVFHVYFPEATHEMLPTMLDDEEERDFSGSDELILLVEDNPDVLQFLNEVLEAHNYRVVLSETLAEARKVLAQRGLEMDLLFTDVMLPDGTGIELARELREERPELPILVGSGYTPSPEDQEFIARHAKAFLPKPYRMADILTSVYSALRSGKQVAD
ncbi:tetratricopeptide repeat protein [Candidatus Fermentibacteria bacterium]|nr:tetratricopeptide repeat protein [Candidatus Fermentibacteria bacterium]